MGKSKEAVLKLKGHIGAVELAEHFIIRSGRYDVWPGGHEGEYEEMGVADPSQVRCKVYRVYCDKGMVPVRLVFDKRNEEGRVVVDMERVSEINKLIPQFGICLRLLERYYTDRGDPRNWNMLEEKVGKNRS